MFTSGPAMAMKNSFLEELQRDNCIDATPPKGYKVTSLVGTPNTLPAKTCPYS